MKVTLLHFLSLDGVSQAPGGPEEDPSDDFTQGGWCMPHIDEAFMRRIVAWMTEADAFLLGRRTYEIFAGFWPKVTDPDDPVATRLNALPKYVASQTLTATDWGPTTILSGDVPAQVAELRKQPGRELQIHGSPKLAQSLLAAGQIDELRLTVAPVLLGHGRRLFPEGLPPTALRHLSAETTPSGLAIHTYAPDGPPEYGHP